MINDVPFKERRQIALDGAESRCAEVYLRSPELKKIDRTLSETGMRIFRAALLPDTEREAATAALARETEALRVRRGELLVSLGYPKDYTEPKFFCPKCSDTGYVGHKLCECLRSYDAQRRAKESGLGKYLDRQTFDTFRPELFPEDPKGDETSRREAEELVRNCREYAERFSSEDGESLLFVGSTGLGKTHLSSAIAKRVIERGFSVHYDSAQNILSAFERERFSNADVKSTDKYFSVDLLIIDDLGTEMRSASSASYFYTLINTRLVASRSVIISTNLSPTELNHQYEPRLVSRLFGEYTVYRLRGQDIRLKMKLR